MLVASVKSTSLRSRDRGTKKAMPFVPAILGRAELGRDSSAASAQILKAESPAY